MRPENPRFDRPGRQGYGGPHILGRPYQHLREESAHSPLDIRGRSLHGGSHPQEAPSGRGRVLSRSYRSPEELHQEQEILEIMNGYYRAIRAHKATMANRI